MTASAWWLSYALFCVAGVGIVWLAVLSMIVWPLQDRKRRREEARRGVSA